MEEAEVTPSEEHLAGAAEGERPQVTSAAIGVVFRGELITP